MTSDAVIEVVAAVAAAELPHQGSVSHGPCGPMWNEVVHEIARQAGHIEVIRPMTGFAEQSSPDRWWVRTTSGGRHALRRAGRWSAEMDAAKCVNEPRRSGGSRLRFIDVAEMA